MREFSAICNVHCSEGFCLSWHCRNTFANHLVIKRAIGNTDKYFKMYGTMRLKKNAIECDDSF